MFDAAQPHADTVIFVVSALRPDWAVLSTQVKADGEAEYLLQ